MSIFSMSFLKNEFEYNPQKTAEKSLPNGKK